MPSRAAGSSAGVRVAGVILAAGRSSRMGELKQLADIDGRPMLAHVVDAALASTLDETLVVLGHQARRVRDRLRLDAEARVRVVEATAYAEGQSASLVAGLRAARDARAILVLLGDEPGVATESIDRVLAAYERADASRTPIVRAVYTGGGRRAPGHPVLFDASVWPELERLCGDVGARAVIAADAARVLEVEIERPRPRDADSPEDLTPRRP